MFSFARPERRSSAGVWIAPQAATTARARTVTRWPVGGARLHPARGAGVDRAPAPPACRTRIRVPAACASASHVLTVDCLAPRRQP